jgi:hypothetical protein
MGFKVVKNGEEILVRDTPENRQKARDQGLTAYDELLSPDGKIVHVNENLSAKAIREKGYKVPEGAAAEQKAYQDILSQKQISPAESAMGGALSTMTWGAGPAIAGATRAIQEGALMSPDPWQKIKTNVAAEGLIEQQRAEKNPLAYFGGALGAGIATPGIAVKGVQGILPSIGIAAGTGALEAASQSALSQLSDPFEKPIGQRVKQVGQSGLTGLIAGGAGGTIARRADIKEALSEAGQAIPEIAKAIPEAGKTVYGAYKRGVKGAEGVGFGLSQFEGLREIARTLSQRQAAQKLLSLDKKRYFDEIGQKIAGDTDLGNQFASGSKSFTDILKRTLVNYAESKGVGAVADQLAKASGIEGGLNVFDPIKSDLEKYLVDEKGLSPTQAKFITAILPSNPLEVIGMVPGSRNISEKGGGQIKPSISDEEYILLRATESGPNKVKDLVSRVSATLFGGRGSASKTLEEQLNVPLAERVKAREFEPYQAAEELKPSVQEAADIYRSAAGKQVEKLLPAAAQEFDTAGPAVFKLASDFEVAMSDANKLSELHPGIKKFINKAAQIWETGEDVSSAGLVPGSYDQVDQMQRFMRLQRARETIDDGIPYDQLKLRDPNQGEQVLMGLRNSIDTVLKGSPSKVKSDAIYAEMKDTLKAVFGRTKYKGDIDTVKIQKSFGETDEAKRFRSHFEKLRKWSQDPTFDQTDRDKMQKFLDQYDKFYKIASTQGKLNRFEWKEGPSSAAVERLGGIVNKDSLVAELFSQPKLALQKMDEFEKTFVNRWTNKNFEDLSVPERLSFIRLRNFMNQNRENIFGMDEQALLGKYQEILDKTQKQFSSQGQMKGGKKGGQGSFFTGGDLGNKLKDAITDYMYAKGTRFIAQAGLQQAGIDDKEALDQIKQDFKMYLQNEYGLSEGQANTISMVLPSSVLDIPGGASRGMYRNMGDVTNFPKKDRFSKYYKDRGYGPFDDEIFHWVEDIKKLPKEAQSKQSKELLSSFAKGEAKMYGYAKNLLEKNNIPIAPDSPKEIKEGLESLLQFSAKNPPTSNLDIEKPPLEGPQIAYERLQQYISDKETGSKQTNKLTPEEMKQKRIEDNKLILKKIESEKKSSEPYQLSPIEKAKEKWNPNTKLIDRSNLDIEKPPLEGPQIAYERLKRYISDKETGSKQTEKWLKKALNEIQDEPYIGRDYQQPFAFKNKEQTKKEPIQPIPVEIEKIGDLKGVLGKGVLTGETDPFAWLDAKYGITKKLLEREKGKPLQIFTRSDLISHDDYINAMDKANHQINIVINGNNKRVARLIEPGAPSILRRINAANKLKELGYNVKIVQQNYKNPQMNEELKAFVDPNEIDFRRSMKEYGLRDDVKIDKIDTTILDEGVQNLVKILGLTKE